MTFKKLASNKQHSEINCSMCSMLVSPSGK